MKTAHEIRTEPDAIKRLVYGAGYDELIEDFVSWKVLLVDKDNKYIKEISMFTWRMMMQEISFKHGSNLAGSTHTWVCEADGSAKRLRNLIRKDESVYCNT